MSYGWGLIEMCKTTLPMGRREDTTKERRCRRIAQTL